MIVAIASQVRAQLLAEAAAALPAECCGLLLGTPGRVEALAPAENVAADPVHSFEIDPATLLRTHREARGAGQAVLGHYHSHPHGRAEPSSRDAARAVDDGQLWLIIGAGRITAWQAGATGMHGRFQPVGLEAA